MDILDEVQRMALAHPKRLKRLHDIVTGKVKLCQKCFAIRHADGSCPTGCDDPSSGPVCPTCGGDYDLCDCPDVDPSPISKLSQA